MLFPWGNRGAGVAALASRNALGIFSRPIERNGLPRTRGWKVTNDRVDIYAQLSSVSRVKRGETFEYFELLWIFVDLIF